MARDLNEQAELKSRPELQCASYAGRRNVSATRVAPTSSEVATQLQSDSSPNSGRTWLGRSRSYRRMALRAATRRLRPKSRCRTGREKRARRPKFECAPGRPGDTRG